MKDLEVRGFGKLYFFFQEKNYPDPMFISYEGPTTANELRKKLEIPVKDVEVVFVNRHVKPLSTPLEEGDRVSFVPPGVPTIHRFNLGFYDAHEDPEDLE